MLKHVRNWSYGSLQREVKANLVYRLFTRIGAEKVPDAKTLGKIALALGPQVIEQIHQRLVAMAQEKQVVQGKKLRLDTTVVETNIHYPTDSSLLGDGVRVWTRTMKKIGQLAGAVGDKLRHRSRSVQHRLIEIGRSSRSRGGKAARNSSRPTASCWPRRAGWWPKPSAFRPRSPAASRTAPTCSS